MNAGIAAYVILAQNTDVTDIVGVNIFPEVAEQETATPFIVYQLLSVAPEDTHDGPSTLDEVRFEFLCYADSYALAADLGSKVRGALDRVSGTYNGVNVESIQFNDVDIDTIDAPRRFAQVLTFTFRIKRDNVEIAQGTPVTGAKLGDLYDVDTTGVTDGQVIAYDAAAQEWQPADDAGGVTQLGQLTDVQFGQGGPELGDLLKYDGSEWTNDSLVKSEIGLGNVDNTSDASKPVSTATQTELNAKANSADFSNVDNTSDADKPVSTATQTALNAKADTSAVPTDLNDLSDVSIVGTPAGNQALIYDATAGAFKSQVSYTNRFEDEVEQGLYISTIYAERGYSVKSEGDGIFIDPSSDTPTAGKVIKRKIYHKTGFISNNDVIGDYTLIHTFADDTAYADTVAVFEAFEEGATYGVPPFTLFQTWEEVTAAPSFTGLLNETYGSGAAAAYSTRRLNGLYSGDCMTIRRASDSTTQSIGFVGEEIDESAIETFCSGTTCTVQVWRDQSGNGNDAEQTNTNLQPTVYTGGALVKKGGRLALEPQGFGGLVVTGLTGQANTNVFEVVLANQSPVISLDSASGQGKFPYLGWNGSSGGVGRGTNFFVDGTSQSWTTRDDAWQTLNNAQRVVSYTVDTSDYSGFALRYGLNNTTYAPIQQEVVIYSSVKSTSDRTDIEGNISEYFQSAKLLDEQFGEGAQAAYSTRQLRRDQTECMVIRRASDSTTTTIGFDGSGNIDEAAIETFCTGTTCTVSEWKDQSGNGNDATQATPANQPTIYTGGAIVKENGRVALDFDGTGDELTHNVSGLESGNFAYSDVLKSNDSKAILHCSTASNTKWVLIGATSTSTSLSDGFITTYQSYFKNGAAALQSGARRTDLKNALFDNNQNLSFINGTTNTEAVSSLYLGRYYTAGDYHYDGLLQESILWTSDKSGTDQTSIEENIGDYFTQNTPLLDTYSGAAAAYSLRLLDSTYTGDAVEVYNGSSYADIGFNVFGELDTVALAAHCGSNNGFVSKWYDQSGNTNTAAQSTTSQMPKIYDGTTGVVTDNGKPAVQSSYSRLYFNSTISVTAQTCIAVHRRTAGNGPILGENSRAFYVFGGQGTYTQTGGVSDQHDYDTFNAQGIHVSIRDGVNPSDMWVNGQSITRLQANLSSQVSGYTAIGFGSSRTMTGTWQEIIIYSSDQSSNRTGIETNINTFYDIY